MTKKNRVGERLKNIQKRDYTQTSMSLLWGLFASYLSLSLLFSEQIRPFNEEEKPNVPTVSFFCFPMQTSRRSWEKKRKKNKFPFLFLWKSPHFSSLSLDFIQTYEHKCNVFFFFGFVMGKSVQHALILRLNFLYMAMPLRAMNKQKTHYSILQ